VPSTIDPARDLLFGMLALQNCFVDEVQLVAAFQAWTRDKSRPIADHLIARGDLDPEDRDVVVALVAKYLKKHGGDPERSLAAIVSGRSTREGLARLGDVDIDASLAHLVSDSTQSGEDPDRTASHAVGTATIDGQRFRVLRPHAQGGLGAVFVALDAELNREVALKQILDRHADDPMSRQRFVIEAEVTGGLEHPGIVPVYALGTYGDGRPYYAMRFIRGDSLKRTIERYHAGESVENAPGQRALELRKLLRRFLDVCNAIDYAHSRGVLHRDIKPANIVVGTHGETLVVDWGLAKVLGRSDTASAERTLTPRSSGSSVETLPGSALGTPAYMSPEQARGDLDHLGPHSDVYSLGATLYFLLTGQPPLKGDDIGAVLSAAQEGRFPPPRKLDPSIDNALEAVCLKAMALAPGDRYQTPRALADDLERWMADEPVSAWREPWSRSVVRWLSRHRTGVTAAGAALLMAVVGLTTVLGVQSRANAELTKKNRQLDASVQREAERFELAMDAIKLFHGDVSQDLLLKEKRFEKLRAKLLRGAADFYGKLEAVLQDQRDNASRAALGRAYDELGTLTGEIGNRSEALDVHRKALKVRRELADQPGATAETVLDWARSMVECGALERNTGDFAAATASFKAAEKRVEEFVASGRGSDAARFVLARALAAQSGLLLESSKPTDGVELNDRATAILQALVDANPGVVEYQERLAGAFTTRGLLSSEPADSLAAYARALPIMEKLAGANPDIWKYQDNLAKTHNNIAFVLIELDKLSEALASHRRAVAIWQRAADANPAATTLQNNVAYGLNNVGEVLLHLGRPAEALEAHSQAKAIFQKLADADPSAIYIKWNIGSAHRFIGWILQLTGRPSQALAEFEQESTIWNELANHGDTTTRDSLAGCETSKAAVQLALGRPGEARTSCDKALSIREDLLKKNPDNTDYQTVLAGTLLRSGQVRRAIGDPVGAAADWRRAIGLYEGLPPRSREPAIFEASCHAMLSSLVDLRGCGVTAPDGTLEAGRAMAILRRITAGSYRGPLLRTEPALDPLRSRPDFQLLMMDVAFPTEPLVP
jgi:eukaryotic-like serine/threonine-protein kinase